WSRNTGVAMALLSISPIPTTHSLTHIIGSLVIQHREPTIHPPCKTPPTHLPVRVCTPLSWWPTVDRNVLIPPPLSYAYSPGSFLILIATAFASPTLPSFLMIPAPTMALWIAGNGISATRVMPTYPPTRTPLINTLHPAPRMCA